MMLYSCKNKSYPENKRRKRKEAYISKEVWTSVIELQEFQFSPEPEV